MSTIIPFFILQLVAIPNLVPLQQSGTGKPTSPAVAIKQSTPAGELRVELKGTEYPLTA